MRILVDYRPALVRRTGVGEYVHETLTALAASPQPGEDLCILSASWKDRIAADVLPPLGRADLRVPGRLLHLLWHRLEWPPVETMARRSFDVVQSAHPLLIPTTARAARIVTIYDLDFLDHPERTVREIRRDYGPLVADHARRADQVIVISRHTAAAVEHRLGVPAARISICTPGAPAWPARASEPASGGSILFLGTLEPRKNLDLLVDAYERLIARVPDAPPLVLAGQISDAAAALVARVHQPPLAGRVQLPGYVPPETREALFRHALVFVLPSHTEGFGLPAVEALRVGVPVIASNRGALPESVGPGGILLDPMDAEHLCAALEQLLADPARRRALADAGRAHVAAFTWQATAAAMREAWRHAIDHKAHVDA